MVIMLWLLYEKYINLCSVCIIEGKPNLQWIDENICPKQAESIVQTAHVNTVLTYIELSVGHAAV